MIPPHSLTSLHGIFKKDEGHVLESECTWLLVYWHVNQIVIVCQM